MSNKKIMIYYLVFAFALILVGCGEPNTSIEHIEDKHFYRVSSQNDQSDRAYVYKSDLSVKETVQLYMEWKKPIDHTDLDNNASVTLFYDDCVYVIYITEEGQTLVQKSSNKYMHHNGYRQMYRPYNRYIFASNTKYYLDKQDKKNTEVYGKSTAFKMDDASSSKVNVGSNDSSKIQTGQNSQSVRNGSTTTRSHTGGGTSYGK
jgi:hypothetical protein